MPRATLLGVLFIFSCASRFIAPDVSSEAARDLILPFATLSDGIHPDSYVTQATFVSASDGTLTLMLEPDGRAWIVPLTAGEPLVLQDLIGEAYQVPLTGWIRARATVPIRAGAMLVNRGRKRSATIAIYAAVPSLPRSLRGGDKLWLVNTEMHASVVVVNGATVTLKAYELRSMPSARLNRIEGSAAVLPFTSRKRPDGNTTFVWP